MKQSESTITFNFRRLVYFIGEIRAGCVSTAVEMDIYKMIRELYAEKVRLDGVIAALEQMQNRGDSSTQPSFSRRRGRKSMKAEERRQVQSLSASRAHRRTAGHNAEIGSKIVEKSNPVTDDGLFRGGLE